jgi:hypothetical protein
MADIKLDDLESIQKLRDIVGTDLFPFRDYDPDDPNVTISITLYRRDSNNHVYKTGSKEFDEEEFGRLSDVLRTAIIQELWQLNPDQEIIEKLKSLGITIRMPSINKKRTWL